MNKNYKTEKENDIAYQEVFINHLALELDI